MNKGHDLRFTNVVPRCLYITQQAKTTPTADTANSAVTHALVAGGSKLWPYGRSSADMVAVTTSPRKPQGWSRLIPRGGDNARRSAARERNARVPVRYDTGGNTQINFHTDSTACGSCRSGQRFDEYRHRLHSDAILSNTWDDVHMNTLRRPNSGVRHRVHTAHGGRQQPRT